MIKTPAIPETIMAGDWTVVSGKGQVDIKKRNLGVPFGNTKQELAIRVHEYGHVRFSPLQKNKEVIGDKKLFLADASVEDFRINHLITKKKVHALKYALNSKQAKTLTIHPSPFMQALLYVSCFHFREINTIKKRLDRLDKKDYEFLESCMDKVRKNPVYKTGFQVAKKIVDKYKETTVKTKNKNPNSHETEIIVLKITMVSGNKSDYNKNGKKIGQGNEETKDDNKETDSDKKPEQNRQKEKTREQKKEIRNGQVKIKVISIGIGNKKSNENNPINNYIKEGIKYGVLNAGRDYNFIKSKPELKIIDETNKIISVEKKREKSDVGMSFRHPERMFTDGLVFGVKKKPKIIGTILIDSSGSMEYNRQDLVDISNKSGGATISAYCAKDYEDEQENKGNLFILAKNGKVVSKLPKEKLTDMNNIVDLEAVEWLCTQPSPRILVTDALFTSISKKSYGNMVEINIERIDQINELCKSNSITWLKNLSELRKILKTLKTGQRFVKPNHTDMLTYLKNEHTGSLSGKIDDYLAGKSKQ